MTCSETKQDLWDPAVAMADPEKSFIVGALAYWEALIAFVVDQPLGSVDYLVRFCDQSTSETVFLNGWTGICTPLFVYLAKVAILVRQKRLSSRMVTMGWNTSVDDVHARLYSCAVDLERLITGYKLPPRSQLYETGDPHISLTQLESMAHCYQLASLLELYRCFPEILTQRVPPIKPSPPPPPPSGPPLHLHHQWRATSPSLQRRSAKYLKPRREPFSSTWR